MPKWNAAPVIPQPLRPGAIAIHATPQPSPGCWAYVWKPGTGTPRRTLLTTDALLGCRVNGRRLICGYESERTPRRIVALDLDTGQINTLFDPNPEFAQVTLGEVHRLNWTNAVGIDTFGDLVLPPDHKPGQRHPLVVVMYDSRGFLRGSTGDEYPVQLWPGRDWPS